jgi:hypothetical protein
MSGDDEENAFEPIGLAAERVCDALETRTTGCTHSQSGLEQDTKEPARISECPHSVQIDDSRGPPENTGALSSPGKSGEDAPSRASVAAHAAELEGDVIVDIPRRYA